MLILHVVCPLLLSFYNQRSCDVLSHFSRTTMSVLMKILFFGFWIVLCNTWQSYVVQNRTYMHAHSNCLKLFKCCVNELYSLVCWQNCGKRLLALPCLSVCLSLCIEQFNSHWMDFHEVWYLGIFKKLLDSVSLKCDKNNGYFLCEDVCTFMLVSPWMLLRLRNVSNKTCRENQNAHCTALSL